MDGVGPDTVDEGAPLDALLENQRSFLRYLESRVGDRALAQDLLQDAFARVLKAPERVPVDEGVVPWFYRTLRNATIDYFRRRSVADRRALEFAREFQEASEPPPDLEREICACISRLARTLKPEYAEAIDAIDVSGVSVKMFAERHGVSPSNAGVRLFRARQALKKRVTESCGVCADHGCRDCSCRN